MGEQSEKLKECIERQTNVSELLNIKALFQRNKQMIVEGPKDEKDDKKDRDTKQPKTNVFVYTAGKTCKPKTTVKKKIRVNATPSRRDLNDPEAMEIDTQEQSPKIDKNNQTHSKQNK